MDKSEPVSKWRLASAQEAREWLVDYNYYRNSAAALLLIGIRDLKQINDRYGREAGDEVIARTADHIRQYLTHTGMDVSLFARMPGREFLLVIKGDLPKSKLAEEARKMVDSLMEASSVDTDGIPISARISVAKSKAGEGGLELLHRAEQALAEAYGRKGERIALAKSGASGSKRRIQTLDKSLRDAIAKGEIFVMFQPQFCVQKGSLIGAEALARWHHEELGAIGADQLFASADRCDLREELSQFLQEEAIKAAAQWPAALDNLKLSVNLGAEELHDEYVEQIAALLAQTDFDPNRLTLELTEENLVRDIDRAAQQLEQIRSQGISIALDDFGTGYSSLAYLKMLPLDYLKLDKSMTPDITGDGKERIVLRAIIAMAQALGLKVIAEGVETPEELDMLKSEGCDYCQGFLLSAPLSPEEFEKFALESD